MTPQKARLLTMEEIEEAYKSMQSPDFDVLLAPFVNLDKRRLLATARAAMKVVEAADKAVALIGWDDGTSGRELQAALQPFQQTGEDKGGAADE